MKKIPLFTAITILFLANSTAVSAQIQERNNVNQQRPIANGSEGVNLTPKKEIILNSKIDNLKSRGINEIDRRIKSLTNVSNKISEMKRLTPTQKSDLTNNLQAEIISLTALKSKIQADTDTQTLRNDIKSIVTSYRVYLLYLPSTQIIVAANTLLNTADKLTELADKLQTRITEEKNKGTDTTNMETLLADMRAKIADAKTQANNAIEKVSALKPTEFPGNKQFLQNAREILQTAHKDIITAQQDSQKIIVELRKLNKNLEKKPTTASESAVGRKPTNFPRQPRILNEENK